MRDGIRFFFLVDSLIPDPRSRTFRNVSCAGGRPSWRRRDLHWSAPMNEHSEPRDLPFFSHVSYFFNSLSFHSFQVILSAQQDTILPQVTTNVLERLAMSVQRLLRAIHCHNRCSEHDEENGSGAVGKGEWRACMISRDVHLEYGRTEFHGNDRLAQVLLELKILLHLWHALCHLPRWRQDEK